MNRFNVKYCEEVTHTYSVIARNDKEAIDKADKVYYNGETDEDVKIISKAEPFNNELLACDLENTGFADDKDKLIDFLRMKREDFLKTYSYIDEEAYELTRKELATRLKETAKEVKENE